MDFHERLIADCECHVDRLLTNTQKKERKVFFLTECSEIEAKFRKDKSQGLLNREA